MTSKRPRPLLFAFLVFLLTSCGGSSGGSSSSHNSSPVPAASLNTLRSLSGNLKLVKNPNTGDIMEYVVIGDGAKGKDLVIFFPGTGGIIPDWPMQMITNSTSSPEIVKTAAYIASEDGPISLAHDYYLVLFDYPGVGSGTLAGSLTGDVVASDVDAILGDVTRQYGLSSDLVDPLGWSLGTNLALKYSFVSPAARPKRKIRNIVLIATRPGGNTDGFEDGNQAACVSTMLEGLQTATGKLERTLRDKSFELTFPYVDQAPYDGIDSGCTATIDTTNETVELNVVPNCPIEGECGRNFANEAANRETVPWSDTGGVDNTVYNEQREFDHDWNFCYCAHANAEFTSGDCSCSGPVEMSDTNGGVCQTVSTGVTTPNLPLTSNCVALDFKGQLTVINGFEDLFIQWTYGQALVMGMQATLGANKAAIFTYPGSDGAGHGVMLQHPGWTEQQIFNALQHG